MPRTLDEIIQGYQSVRDLMTPTPLPPTAMMATMPPWATPTMATPMGGMGMMGTPMAPTSYYNQQDLVRRAMPVLPPMMPMGNPAMMAMQYQTPIPQVTMGGPGGGFPGGMTPQMPMLRGGGFGDPGMRQALALTAQMADPRRAADAMAQQWGEKVGGWGSAVGGVIGGFTPLGPLAGGMLGDWVGGALMNNSLTRGIYKWWNQDMIQQVSRGAQLQQGLAGNLQIFGPGAAFGGTGLSMTGGLELGQRFQAMGREWAQRERMAGRSVEDQDTRRYVRDLQRIATEGGAMGLLDAATNIDQIAETTSKLMKVLGRMAKITGDPDFRNNMREIVNLRQMGFSIDQAVGATQGMAMYARGAGVTRADLMAQGGALGVGAFQQAGLAGGVGLLYGGAAQATARSMVGTMTPIQEMLAGGQQGIQASLVQRQAAFASGPAMNAMLGAAMSVGPSGQLTLDPGRLSQMLRGGMDFSRLAGASQTNLNQIAATLARQQGRSQQDVMLELIRRLPEMQSEMAQALGPEGMDTLRIATAGALSKRFGREAGAALAGVDIREMDPVTVRRRTENLRYELAKVAGQARREAAARDDELDEQRAYFRSAEYRARRAGIYLPGLLGENPAAGRGAAYDAEQKAMELERRQDEAQGIQAGYFSQTMAAGLNARVASERAAQMRAERQQQGFGTARAGMSEFARARAQLRETGTLTPLYRRGAQFRMSADLLGLAQEAAGEREYFFDRIGAGAQRLALSMRGAGGWLEETFTQRMPGARESLAKMSPVVRQAYEQLDRTLATADVIDRTRNQTIGNVGDQLNKLKVSLGKKGMAGGKVDIALNTMRSNLVDYAEKIGRGEGGVTLDKATILAKMRESLSNQGISDTEIEHFFRLNEDKLADLGMGIIRQFGGAEAKGALEKTVTIGGKILGIGSSTEDLQKGLEAAQKKMESDMEAEGITLGTHLTAEEKVGLAAVVQSGSAEEAAATRVIAAAMGGTGIAPELQKAAQAQLQKMITDTDPKMRAAVEKAKEKVSKMSTQAREMAGRMLKPLEKYAGGVEGVVEAERQARTKGIGFLSTGYEATKIAAIAEAQGKRVEGEKIVETTAVGGTPETQARAETLQAAITGLEDVQKIFGDAGSEIKIAAIQLTSAAGEIERAAKALKD